VNKEVGKLRPSQVITTFGPGAIVDLPDYSVIMGGINKWLDNDMLRYSTDIDEPRLTKKLRIDRIRSIPVPSESAGIGTLPAYRFPEYHVCPNCKRLGTSKNFDFTEEDGVLYCQNRHKKDQNPCEKIKTHPVRFLTACSNGHIDDFPWGFYLHAEHDKKYDHKKCHLYLEDSGKTGSIKDLVVTCTTCEGIERTMNDAFSKHVLPKCQGRRPWLGLNNMQEQPCELENKLLLRGASNLYFPILESSIVIPFQDNPLEDLLANEIDLKNEGLVSDFNIFSTVVSFNKKLKHYSVDQLWSIAQRFKNNSIDEKDLLMPEWDAITSGQNQLDNKDFEVEVQETPSKYKSLISKLIRVKRLKEVMVLKGFTRINPTPDASLRLSGEQNNDDDSNELTAAPLSDTTLDWLPGVESFGEGIFLAINEAALKDWENENEEYAKDLKIAHKNHFIDRKIPEDSIPPFPGIRYVMLHTLSHALMRELCLHSGYSSSALKERIYSDSEKGMAGILIYTATVDSEGSLGGLVELGKTQQFESVISRALSAAKYCSGDPLCAEQASENMQDVNGAACHSCMLMSETSCEKANRYLDRSVLVPTVATLAREFFKDD